MSLSPKEIQILTMVALGYCDKEIGIILGISYGTVRTHIDRIVMKLRARNRSHAIIIYKLRNKDWLEDYYKEIKRDEYDSLLQYIGNA